LLLLVSGAAAVPAFSTEYFAGPFASWLNVKTGYGAAGNGTTDDTAAIQAAINAINSSASVVYLPAGTYKITSTLKVQNLKGFSFIGASPAATTLLWAGSSGGTMMQVEATTSSNWGRITWEGSSSAGIGVAHTCPGSCSGGFGPTNLLHFDEVFQDLGKGIAGGVGQVVDNSEMTITRCTFQNCSYAGLSVESYNALDYWVWDSQFLNNARGLTNDVSGGNFMAYRCFFQNSSIADIKFTNTEFFSFRDNTSIGSNQFINGLGSNNPAEVSVQGNRIVNTTNPNAIYLNNLGPVILVDNQIQSQSGATAPCVQLITPNGTNVGGPDLISIGNQYTVSNPITLVTQILAPGQTARWWSQEDTTVAYGSISSSAPAMPPLPTQLSANITDMPVGASAAAIQAAINAATGANPVIHLPAGQYNLSQPLTFPANLAIFLVGDNQGTRVSRTTYFPGGMFELNGPSKATIRDMALNGQTGDGIQVLGADQSGARVFGEGFYMSTDRTGDVLADNLANTHVDLQGIQPARAGQFSVQAIGTGSPGASRVALYGVAGGTTGGVAPSNGWMYEVTNGGQMLVEDAWYESSDSPTVVNLGSSDSGAFCLWGGTLGQGSSGGGTPPGPPVFINGFSGLASFLNLQYALVNGSYITVIPQSQTQALFLGQAIGRSDSFSTTGGGGGAGGSGTVVFQNNKGTSGQQVPDQGNARTAAFVDNLLALARNNPPETLTDLPSGVTDVRLYRISFNNCGMALHITGNSAPPTPVPTSGANLGPGQPAAYAYPLPAQSQITIAYASNSAQTVQINIYAFSGEQVATVTGNAQPGNGNKASFSVQAFAPGIYFYVIHGTGGVLAKGKFLVTR